MKVNKSLLVVTLAWGTVWAQAPAPLSPPQNPPAHATKPAPTATKSAPGTPNPAAKPGGPAKSSVVPPPKPAQKQSGTPTGHIVPIYSAKPTSQPAAKTTPPVPATKNAAPVAVKPASATGETKQAAVKETETASRVAITGKQRDPFVSPIVRSNGVISSGCDTGKRCLVVDQIVLKGIVKSGAGYIALVENPAKRAYFMRENDSVFNGRVVKITGDTMVFEEQTTDKLGKQGTREVVKKVNAPIV